MNWEQYKIDLNNNLEDWFTQVILIQNKEFSDSEILFDLNKNTLDAFSAMVDVYSSNSNFDHWIENEKIRQRQKSLQGKIGDLHEIMIISLKASISKRAPERVEGEDKPKRIFDLYDADDKWIAEIKNKHNTTKGEDRKASFDKLEKGLEISGEEYKAYYVTILRSTHERVCNDFTPSDNTADRNKKNEKIIHMDGESFYAFITGEENALSTAFDKLEEVLRERFNFQTTEPILSDLKSFSFFTAKININTADKLGLSYLPGIGPIKIEDIIQYRERNGGFESVDDLKRIKGIGTKMLENIMQFAEV